MDTPLSTNHALMKGKPLRASLDPPNNMPQISYFGGLQSKSFATPQAMGISGKTLNAHMGQP